MKKYLQYTVSEGRNINLQKLHFLSKTKFQTVSQELKQEISLKNNKHFIIIFNHNLLILSSNLTASIFFNIYFVCHFPLFSSQALSSTDDVIFFLSLLIYTDFGEKNYILYIGAKLLRKRHSLKIKVIPNVGSFF